MSLFELESEKFSLILYIKFNLEFTKILLPFSQMMSPIVGHPFASVFDGPSLQCDSNFGMDIAGQGTGTKTNLTGAFNDLRLYV